MKLTPFKLFLFMALIFLIFSGTAVADRVSETIKVFKKSEAVLPFFDEAYGYAVFPAIGKGGFVIGGAYGSGRVYRQGRITGTTTLTKISVGFQLLVSHKFSGEEMDASLPQFLILCPADSVDNGFIKSE